MTGAADQMQAVVLVVVALGVPLALWGLAGTPRLYRRIGRGGLDVPDRIPGPPPGSTQARAEREAELRQLLEAKSAHLQARGEHPLDVELELAVLFDPGPWRTVGSSPPRPA